MVTLIMLIRKRRDLTREQFIEYYETRHIGLIGRLVGGSPKVYRRHYPVEDDALVRRLAEARGDDVVSGVTAVTELAFERYEEAEAMVDRMLAEGVLGRVLDDERQFIAPGGISWMLARR